MTDKKVLNKYTSRHRFLKNFFNATYGFNIYLMSNIYLDCNLCTNTNCKCKVLLFPWVSPLCFQNDKHKRQLKFFLNWPISRVWWVRARAKPVRLIVSVERRIVFLYFQLFLYSHIRKYLG